MAGTKTLAKTNRNPLYLVMVLCVVGIVVKQGNQRRLDGCEGVWSVLFGGAQTGKWLLHATVACDKILGANMVPIVVANE